MLMVFAFTTGLLAAAFGLTMFEAFGQASPALARAKPGPRRRR